MPFSRRPDFARAQTRNERADRIRSGQNLAGSRRGHCGNDRLPGILRPRDAAPRRSAESDTHEGREELPRLHSPRRWRRHSPWNFPAAIMAGMVMASLVTGNTVVLKPAGDTMTVAAKFVEIAYEAGIPKEALNFVTGAGSTVGDALVQHPKTRYIAFTGSKEVGLRISELAGKTVPGQMWIKRTVLEMGGKDSIIVDEEGDVDAAVEGVAQAAFGYQGQKCSACSRAIVSQKIYDSLSRN